VIDTHAHLDALDDDPADVVARAREAGVTRILTVGTTPAGCRRALELVEQFDEVFAILGIHPHEGGHDDRRRRRRGRELLAHPRAVAVGETGLDWFRDYAPPEAQKRLFAQELELARETQKPVVIHTRAADADTLAALAGFDGGRAPLLLVAAPARRRARARLVRLVRRQRVVPKAVDLRLAATQVPADRILAETDCPYLAPQPVRGRRNEPAYVVYTVAALAQARGEDAAELGRAIERNAAECFGLPA
jgi:Mg-dependent DNase